MYLHNGWGSHKHNSNFFQFKTHPTGHVLQKEDYTGYQVPAYAFIDRIIPYWNQCGLCASVQQVHPLLFPLYWRTRWHMLQTSCYGRVDSRVPWSEASSHGGWRGGRVVARDGRAEAADTKGDSHRYHG